MASKITYVFEGGYYYSSRKKGAKRVASLPKGYEKDSDGVYRFHKTRKNSARRPPKGKLSRRVGKALKKYVRSQVGLPKDWTNAKVRVDSKGEIQLKMNPADLGKGTRFAKSVAAVTGKRRAKRR